VLEAAEKNQETGGVIWNGICGRITERQRWLSEGERAGSRFSRDGGG